MLTLGIPFASLPDNPAVPSLAARCANAGGQLVGRSVQDQEGRFQRLVRRGWTDVPGDTNMDERLGHLVRDQGEEIWVSLREARGEQHVELRHGQ